MEQEIIDNVVKIDKQIKELECIQKNNFDNFCIGLYYEDYQGFHVSEARKIQIELRNKCKDLYLTELKASILILKEELKTL